MAAFSIASLSQAKSCRRWPGTEHGRSRRCLYDLFLPTEQAGLLALGSEARLVLDAAPDLVIPANISFVASVAQFTPKTVETSDERLKLMFRVKARIPPELLAQHTGMSKPACPVWLTYGWINNNPA